MLDVSSLVNATGLTPSMQGVQSLPMQSQQTLRLDSTMTQKLESVGVNGLDAAGSSLRDAPVLQVKEPITTERADFQYMLLNKATEMDQSYHDMMSQFSQIPKFSDALAEVRKSGIGVMRTYPDTASSTGVDAAVQHIKQSAMETVQIMQASSTHNQMITKWGINSQLWMTKMNIVTTAVSQVSQGIKTLFRLSG